MLIFAFKGNISEKVALSLNYPDTYILNNNYQDIQRFVDQLVTLAPNKILGLGQYTRRDQGKIKVELVCTNKFRNQLLGNEPEKLVLSSFIPKDKRAKFNDNGMGNSYCNLAAYLIQKEINKNGLTAQFDFLHIPDSMDEIESKKVVNSLINH